MTVTFMPSLIQAIELYCTALHECSLAKFDQVFHPSCSLFDSLEGVLTAMPIAEYREVIAKRTSPHSVGQARDDALISLDFLSPDAAVVKLRIRIHDQVFLDHLSFARVDHRFMIVAKVWHEITAQVRWS